MPRRNPPLIAHLIYRLDVGGLENGLVNLINRIPQERYRHAIVCLAGFSAEYRRRINRRDVQVVSVDKRPGKDPAAYLRMWRTIRRLSPDIVHTRNLGTADMLWVAALAGVRTRVHGEHGWDAADPHGTNPRHLGIRRVCAHAADLHVAMSRDIARWLESRVGVPASRIRQLYNGVDAQRFCPGGAHPHDFPWQPGVEPQPVVIGTLGRLDPVKDQATLLRAVELLGERGAGARIVLAGGGPLLGTLQAQGAAAGLESRTWFAGVREDSPAMLRSFDIFVLPSVNEGISNTILEAMATGLPVVTTRVGGNPELVEDGVTGRLFEVGDAAGLAAILREYITDPELRRAHGQAGRRRVMQNFSLDTMVDSYLDLYDQLLAGK